jgi:hypothetical protein
MKLTKKEIELRRKVLPYGAYIGADGTETLFDRSYAPIIARDANGNNLQRAHGWITHTKQIWFYDDSCSPHHSSAANTAAYQRCLEALNAFIKGESLKPYVYSEN